MNAKINELLGEIEKCRVHLVKRYCYSLDYDWDRLDYLARTFEKVTRECPSDIDRFTRFLKRLRRK